MVTFGPNKQKKPHTHTTIKTVVTMNPTNAPSHEMKDSEPSGRGRRLPHWTPHGTDGVPVPSSFFCLWIISGVFSSAVGKLPPRERPASSGRAWGTRRGPEEPSCLSLHTLISSSGKLGHYCSCCSLSAFQGRRGQRDSPMRGALSFLIISRSKF